jgi:flagellar assembly protein FliH
MGRPLVLEDFDRPPPAPVEQAPPPAAAADLEEERLQSFEKGYSAGWEDAARAHAEEQDSISAEFGRALQDMSFTFHEAQAALMQEVEGILAGIVETVLPEALQPALADMIRARAVEAARQSGATVEVVVAPENVARVEALAEGRLAPPLRVVGEPALGGGQAFLRFGQAEEKIDLDATLADLSAAVARFAADGAGPADPSGAPAAPDAPRHDEETRHA